MMIDPDARCPYCGRGHDLGDCVAYADAIDQETDQADYAETVAVEVQAFDLGDA